MNALVFRPLQAVIVAAEERTVYDSDFSEEGRIAPEKSIMENSHLGRGAWGPASFQANLGLAFGMRLVTAHPHARRSESDHLLSTDPAMRCEVSRVTPEIETVYPSALASFRGLSDGIVARRTQHLIGIERQLHRVQQAFASVVEPIGPERNSANWIIPWVFDHANTAVFSRQRFSRISGVVIAFSNRNNNLIAHWY